MLVTIAAVVYAVLIGTLVIFQLALASGRPWGEYAMGGRFPGRYPPGMRVTAVFQAVILAAFGLIVLTRAGMVFPGRFAGSTVMIWVVAGYAVLAVILNLITPSKKERNLWAPVTVVMAAACWIVALS
jgi:hypothetical protein